MIFMFVGFGIPGVTRGLIPRMFAKEFGSTDEKKDEGQERYEANGNGEVA